MRWFVVQTYSGAEWQTHRGLMRRGIESYYPHFWADARRGRFSQATLKPQFPTYMFAGLELGESTNAILSTTGVRDLLRQGVEIVTLADRTFESIREHCEENNKSTAPRIADVRRWRPGDVVPMPYGPLVGVPVQISHVDKSGRIGASIGALRVSFQVSALQKSVRGSSWHAENNSKPSRFSKET